jgi:hypothetical protein
MFLVRRQRRPDLQVVFIASLRLAPQNRDISEQEIAQRPKDTFLDSIGIPISHGTRYIAPLAQVLSAALDPAAALQFRCEDFREILAYAVAN